MTRNRRRPFGDQPTRGEPAPEASADRPVNLDAVVQRVGGAEERLVSLEEYREHQWVLERDLIADIAGLRHALARNEEALARVEGALRARPARDSVDRLLAVDGPKGPRHGVRRPRRPGGELLRRLRGRLPGRPGRDRPATDVVRDLISDHQPVVDLGCGRGELLEVLRDRDVAASGWDLDPGMVREAHDAGLDGPRVTCSTRWAAWPTAPSAPSSAPRSIEHLPPSDMPRLFAEAHRVLDERGVAVVETVNPHSVEAFRFFWLDTTHTIPVYPESALMMARAAGFAAAVVVFPGGTGDAGGRSRDVRRLRHRVHEGPGDAGRGGPGVGLRLLPTTDRSAVGSHP